MAGRTRGVQVEAKGWKVKPLDLSVQQQRGQDAWNADTALERLGGTTGEDQERRKRPEGRRRHLGREWEGSLGGISPETQTAAGSEAGWQVKEWKDKDLWRPRKPNQGRDTEVQPAIFRTRQLAI